VLRTKEVGPPQICMMEKVNQLVTVGDLTVQRALTTPSTASKAGLVQSVFHGMVVHAWSLLAA